MRQAPVSLITLLPLSLSYSILLNSVYWASSMCLSDDYQIIAVPSTMIMIDRLVNTRVLVPVKIMNGESTILLLFHLLIFFL